jgi:5-(carboxyamino)imidazole ribonucleotide synthase
MFAIYDELMKQGFPRVGVIGAGQLARMMVAPSTALGIDLLLFAQSESDSGAQVCKHVIGDYRDSQALLQFAASVDVITFEHELVPLSVIRSLENAGHVVRPSSSSFIYSQDKAKMRERLSSFPVPHWQVVTSSSEVKRFPVIAKAISGGYDGRGVWKIESEKELTEVLTHTSPLLIEELIEFDSEIAVMVARSPHGQAASWAPTQTVQEEGICTITITPAQEISEEVALRGAADSRLPSQKRSLE